MVVAPWARRRYIDKRVYNHTSILKMIEKRWSLPPLTVRDQTANNLANVLDFSSANLGAPQYTVPAGPFGTPCGTPNPVQEDWSGLLTLAQSAGWPIY